MTQPPIDIQSSYVRPKGLQNLEQEQDLQNLKERVINPETFRRDHPEYFEQDLQNLRVEGLTNEYSKSIAANAFPGLFNLE